MLQHIENYNKNLTKKENNKSIIKCSDKNAITVSVELEKLRPELLDLLPYADVVFVSKEFAESRGYLNMRETIINISQESKSG